MKFYIYVVGSRRIIVLHENRRLADESVENDYGSEMLKLARNGFVEEYPVSNGFITHFDASMMTEHMGQ